MAARAKRSRNGCLTCRKRRVKCDEIHPTCTNCTVHRFSCEWPSSANDAREVIRPVSPSRGTRAVAGNRLPAIPPALSFAETDLQCANSLVLTPQDRHLLAFFPSTTIFLYYDFGAHSSLRYLAERLSRSSSIVMSMVLAISAGELQKRGDYRWTSSLSHYNVALKQLNNCVAQGSGLQNVEDPIAAIFLMMNYELRFFGAHSVERMKAHLGGLWALISTHPFFQSLQHDDSPPDTPKHITPAASFSLCCQLILWCLYLDVSMTSIGQGGTLSGPITRSTSPFFDWKTLVTIARRSNSRLWRDMYSPDQRVTDMEFFRLADMGHEMLSTRFRIWDFKTNGGDDDTARSMLEGLLSMQERYSDMILVAETAGMIPWKATVECLVRIVAFYWATLLYYCHTIDEQAIGTQQRQETVHKLTSALHIHHEQQHDKRFLGRIIWPTFIAAIETNDAIHRSWLLDRLRESRNLTSECYNLCVMAENILAGRKASGPYPLSYSADEMPTDPHIRRCVK